MAIDRAYEVFYRALHGALLNHDTVQGRLAKLVFELQDLEQQDIPDEQIWSRFITFIQEIRNRTWADESLGWVMRDDEAASYLEQALSLFGAIAIAYGQQGEDDRS